MERQRLPIWLWLWSALNMAAYGVLVGYATAGTVAVLLVGSDHEPTYLVDVARPALYGAAAGLLVAVLVSLAQRRASVWAAPIVYAGVVLAWFAGTPAFFLVPPIVLAVSGVLRAWFGRRYEPLLPLAARHWIGAGLTAVPGARARQRHGTRRLPRAADPGVRRDARTTRWRPTSLPGLRVVSDSSTDESDLLFGGKIATVSREWEITDDARPRAALDRLETMAAESGWKAGGPSSCPWARAVDDIDLCLWIVKSSGSADIEVLSRGASIVVGMPTVDATPSTYDVAMGDDVRNVQEALSAITEHWQPHRLTSINDYDVKVVKLQGEFVWHTHPDTDELFMVVSGRADDPAPRSRRRPRSERCVCRPPGHRALPEGGGRRCTRSSSSRRGTVNTGDVGGEMTSQLRRALGRLNAEDVRRAGASQPLADTESPIAVTPNPHTRTALAATSIVILAERPRRRLLERLPVDPIGRPHPAPDRRG